MNEKLVNRLIEEYEIRREKIQKFLDAYPRLVRAGFIAIFTIPIFFMILMFSVESKLIFLVLWIISIILIAGYLIGIEYFYFYYVKLKRDFEELMTEEEIEDLEERVDEDNMESI